MDRYTNISSSDDSDEIITEFTIIKKNYADMIIYLCGYFCQDEFI